ncbi:hypothetical protein [Kitasatospora sp. NBC_00458]|uniref:hypothetical protein n=1 Tax=Kitasatospora sp. NBC_00458 TaxID=2903568 RepID=UPI002E186C23
MTADGGRARGAGGAAARLLVLCALLAGLFLMHGSPTAAAGCHEPAAAPAPAMTAAAPAAAVPHLHTPDGPPVPDGPPALDGPRTAHGDGAPTAAASCVTARDRDGAGLPAAPPSAGAPAVPVALSPPDGPPGRRADEPRGPPAAGRRLLSQVCVSRT